MKKVKTSAKGRVCRYRNCHNILSIYNHEEYCHVHQLMALSGNTANISGRKKTRVLNKNK
ncbi:MAG: hypothetical protein BWY16_00333 [Candidatus Omnitrophica bacterium ADurb.Bin205]|nr:MAG: hypothetical protein BWY16_00333 [Candidatus Omnitrophica bacterium ADurb.Bin205]